MFHASRRALLGSLPLALASPLLLPGRAKAAFPERVVTLVNGFAAGGSSDIAARIAAPRISQALGQTVVVENRPGAGGALALAWIRRQPADGHTVILADPSSLVIAPMVQPETVTYRPTEDFTPLSVWGTTPMVLVVATDHPARDVAGLVAWIRAQQGRASYASSGIGSTPQLAAELFLQRAGGDPAVTHVPYRGGGQMLEAVMKDECGFGFPVLSSAAGHLRGGVLRALAVSGPTRSASFPEVPTMAEAGFRDFDLITWYMLLGPPGMAPAVQSAWSAAMAATLADAATKERLEQSGLDPAPPSPPSAAAAYLARETAGYGAIIAAAGARLRG
ncbi:Bug family tripartite tricarboxylate transporter substrate binding protein [Roseococcus pinisoli]|uniref:Tripartite tricarboxylate transporter substrate binding protein n=1 Tax=Roseococcus pinisoli TaxID=2835040 RepID=A0ABS5QE52_9PROT|nr:tripartite tricarboxylate transporter substrate binding protein [Roseococcus pinisoli]MBS7811817.1 tripartite tricarboxylate transporter substrate binding protein [Roseococcus pinisoli]